MANLTRIKNNQITDTTITANTKVVDYTVTSSKLANNLVYGSDLTISGNLTVNGNTTTVNTEIVTIEDPMITLAYNQTGTPTLDIGFIGERGTSNNIAFVWQESSDQFIAAYTSDDIANTTITVLGYANMAMLDANVTGTLTAGNVSFTGNVVGDLNVTGNTTSGNLLTAGLISAGGNVRGGNFNTAGLITATGNVTGGNVLTDGLISAAGNATVGNVTTAGLVTATGNITGGNVTTAGLVSAAGNIVANPSSFFIGNGSQLTGVAASTANAETLTGTFLANNVVGSSLTSVGDLGNLSVVGNTTTGNLLTGGLISATGTITSAANVTGGNLVTGGLISATGNINTPANVNAQAGNINAQGGLFTGNITVLGNINGAVTVVGNSATFYGDAVTGNGAIYAGIPTFTPLASNVVIQFAGNVNSYSQVNFQNVNAGNIASTDYIATADNGNDTSYYVDLGINSSTFNDPADYPGYGPNDSYVHNHGGNLILNPETAGKAINFMVGGTDTTDIIATMSNTQLSVSGIVSATGNVTGGNILTSGLISATGNITGGNIISSNAVIGNINVSGNIAVNSLTSNTIVSAGGNITGGNLLTGGLISAAGLATSGNVETAGYVSATGNVYGGNVNTAQVYGANTLTLTTAVGDLLLEPVGNIALGNRYINGVAYPVQDQDAASKSYVDNMVSSGLAFHEAVVVATTANLATTTGGSITYNQPNGAGNGIGATLTTTGSFNLIDSANVQTVGTRILVKNEGNAVFNGVYTWSNATVITRSTDTDQYGPDSSEQFSLNDYFFVSGGNINLGSAYVVDAPTGTITFGTSNISFAQFSQSQVYSANTSAGLQLIGQQFNAKVDENTTSFDLGGNIIVKAGANLTTPNIGAATGTSLNVTGNVQSGNLLANAAVIATGNVSGANITTVGLISATGNVTGNYFIGNGSQLTGVVASSANAETLTGTFLANNVVGSSLTSVGDLTALSVVGTATVGNLATSGTVSATGNVTGGNVLTGGLVSSTGNVTGGNILTGGIISAAGNINAPRLQNGGTGLTIDSGFPGFVQFFNGNGSTVLIGDSGNISAVGNITGGNLLTSGLISATGAVTSAGFTTTGNVTGGNLLFGSGIVSGTGNIYADTIFANISGNIDAGGANTNIQFNDDNVLAGSTGFTFNKVGNVVTANGNISGANLISTGNIFATSAANVTFNDNTWFYSGYTTMNTGGIFHDTGANPDTIQISTNSLANGIAMTTNGTANSFVVSTGGIEFVTVGTLNANTAPTGGVSRVQITTDGLTANGIVSATGNVTGGNVIGTTSGKFGNIVISGDDITDTAGRVNINTAGADVDFAVNGDTVANVFYVDAGTGTASFGSATQTVNAIVAFNSTNSILTPVGNTGQRPATGVTGMLRFNTTDNNLELFDNSQWTAVGVPSFTVIADEQFNGDGANVAFTLGSSQTTNSCIVSINGVVQIPTTAYSVSGTFPTCVLTFTEAPLSGDLIDVREITTTTTVTAISNSSGNAVIETSPTAATVLVTGDLSVNGTILGGNINSTAITNGTSNVAVASSNGNVVVTVAGNGIVSFTPSGIINNQANGVGNIGSSTTYFNTVFAQATSAQYADLAEKYVADAEYAPGTVVVFGGTHEVTVNATDSDRRVAGVISTNPSYIMNGGLEADHVATVALTGRVPTMVVGPVKKGDMMVAAGLGRARAEADPKVGTVIGKALEDFDGAEGTIEVVVGRF